MKAEENHTRLSGCKANKVRHKLEGIMKHEQNQQNQSGKNQNRRHEEIDRGIKTREFENVRDGYEIREMRMNYGEKNQVSLAKDNQTKHLACVSGMSLVNCNIMRVRFVSVRLWYLHMYRCTFAFLLGRGGSVCNCRPCWLTRVNMEAGDRFHV